MKRSMKKVFLATAAAIGLTFLTASPVYAGQWQQDGSKWWWQNEDGSYPVNQWAWIDGNHDGEAECYYFDNNGYMISNTTIQGMCVDYNGCMTEFGVVQTVPVVDGKDFKKAFDLIASFDVVQNIDSQDPSEISCYNAETELQNEEIDPYELAYKIITLVNEEREQKGKSSLDTNEELMENAMLRAEEAMNANIDEEHIRPDGSSCFTAITVEYVTAAENIAYTGGHNVEQIARFVVDMWIDSPMHHVNMIQAKWTITGVGAYIEESATGPKVCVVQLFVKE